MKFQSSWTAWFVVGAAVFLNAVATLVWYPNLLTVVDETAYVRHAAAFAQGRVTTDVEDVLTGEVRQQFPSRYPPGTSLLMAPFVGLFGWRGAFLVPLLSLALATLLTAHWLGREGLSPLFALWVMLYLPCLILGRLAMSDVLSVVFVVGALYAFWIGLDRSQRATPWLVSGFIAGASCLIREAVPLVIAPFFAGTLFRRDRGIFYLITGGLVGTALRPLLAVWIFGDPLFTKAPNAFGLEFLPHTLPFYVALGTLLVPFGLPCALVYRGRRRPELVTSVIVFILFYSVYDFQGAQSGLLKSIVLGGRFLAPLVPVLAFAVASVLPAFWNRIAGRRPGLVDNVQRMGPYALLAVAILASFVVHPFMSHWEGSRRDLRDALYRHTSEGSSLVISLGVEKYVNELYSPRPWMHLNHLDEEGIARLANSERDTFLVVLRRKDSDAWREQYREATNRIEALERSANLLPVWEQDFGSEGSLRILKLGDARPAAQSSPSGSDPS